MLFAESSRIAAQMLLTAGRQEYLQLAPPGALANIHLRAGAPAPARGLAAGATRTLPFVEPLSGPCSRCHDDRGRGRSCSRAATRHGHTSHPAR
eukprot:scaffold4372_cov397-Prasinococcus_capsulatus_cf.AAC.54